MQLNVEKLVNNEYLKKAGSERCSSEVRREQNRRRAKKIVASLSTEDQQQPQPPSHQKEKPVQRPNQFYRRKCSKTLINVGVTCVLLNNRTHCVSFEVPSNENLKAEKL